MAMIRSLSTFAVLSAITLGSLSPHRSRAATATATPKPVTLGDTAAPLRGMSIDGKVYALANDPRVRATGIVFMSTQCPISNKYVPELNRLSQSHANDGVRFFGVISDPSITRAAAAQYVK